MARPLAPSWPGAPPRARVDVRVDHVATHEGSVAVDGPVVVVGPATWVDAQPGARVRAEGRWSVLPAGDRAAAVLVTDDGPTVVAPSPSADAAAATIRAAVTRQAAALPGDAGAVLPGVTVGDTGGVPEDLRDALRVAGLTHLTAVSGAHFALVGALAVACVTAMGAPRAVRAVAVVVVGAALVLLVGPSPSVVRAAAMAAVGCAGLVVGRRSASPAALAAAVVALLLGDPWLASELGFVLSVLATGGLVLLGGPLADRWAAHLPRPAATALAAPVAAHVACAPAVLLVTPTVSVLGVVANLLAAPAVAPATVLGLAAAVIGTGWPAAGQVLAVPAGAACWWIGAVARAVAATPGAALTWLPGGPGGLLLAVAGAATVRLCWPSRSP
ncbi:ComEC/Rec2 family competence protein [Cellulomonas fimi]|uniref:ComEC/Rec2 family competence protein n=1 Tax=Cellulomonas fimi TaxID=1708 RepID=UPI00234D713E|nr:ComEC/Rec2 family competence protein [Cellulomonas fimi]MDC7121033.1 ComEC/Rec2 family competence protein [Cellulomonas fimi]